MVNNFSLGFVYLISGLHILGGVAVLGWTFYRSLKNFSYLDSSVFSVNPFNQLKMKLITVYWHFVDVLWLYLFCFSVFTAFVEKTQTTTKWSNNGWRNCPKRQLRRFRVALRWVLTTKGTLSIMI